MARKKLDLNALEVDSFSTVEKAAPRLGTVYGHDISILCPGDETTNPASWDAGCTVGCTTHTDLDGPTCGAANCGETGGGATWNNPSCAPNQTCGDPASCAATGCAFYSCGMCWG